MKFDSVLRVVQYLTRGPCHLAAGGEALPACKDVSALTESDLGN